MEKSPELPPLMTKDSVVSLVDRNLILPTYPSGAILNSALYESLSEWPETEDEDMTKMQNRRDAAYWIQTETQQAVLDLIIRSVEKSGNKNVVLSGGYGLNCVANYFYLTELNKLGINLYVEPQSNDGGTATGAALYWYYKTSGDTKVRKRQESLYLGPKYSYMNGDF